MITLTPKRLAVALAVLTVTAVGVAALPDRSTPPADQCYQVPQQQLDRLQEPTMQRNGGHLIVQDAAAYRGEKEWFIAAEFTVGDAGDTMVGVWATQDLAMPHAPLFAAEPYSRAFTAYPEAPLAGQAHASIRAERCMTHATVTLRDA